MIVELWVNIPEMEKYYQASNKGRIRSKDRSMPWKSKTGTLHIRNVKGKILSPARCKYLQVHLSINNKHYMRYVHRLVALCWIPNLDKFPEVDHINGDRYDNSIDNLRWVMHNTNIQASYNNLQHKHGEVSCKAKLSENQMFEIRNIYERKKLSQQKIGELYGISQTQVGHIVRGVRWKRVIGGGKAGGDDL